MARANPLLLASGQVHAFGSHLGFQALGKLRYDIGALRRLERFLHLGARGARTRDGHVVEDAHAEEPIVLECEGHEGHQLMRIDVAHVHATDEHLALIDVPESGNEARSGRLPAARRSDQRERRRRRNLEGNPIDRRGIGARI